MRTAAIASGSLLMLLGSAPLSAQGGDSLPAWSSLRTPTSPAFVVLGIAPTAVERPSTPADLAFSILNKTANFSSIPRDAALELSPYWLIGHPRLTWSDDTTRSVGTSLARTATVSFATAELGTSGRPIRGLALGFRASPVSGRLSDSTIARLRRLEARLSDESVILDALIRDRRAALIAEAHATLAAARTKADSDAVLELLNTRRAALAEEAMNSARYRAAVDASEREFRGLAVTRRGFVMEIAAGAAWSAPGGVADSARVTRWGAWLTAGYEGPEWTFVMVNRFLAAGRGAPDSALDALDVGIRLLHTSERATVSAEGVFRAFTERGAPGNEYRLAAVVDYAVAPGVWLTGTFGRDYSAGAPGSVLAQFGVSVDFAGERLRIPRP